MDDTPKRFLARPATPFQLPHDGPEAEAALASFIRGDAEFWPRAELEAQRQRVEALRDPLAQDSLDELTRQLPTLSALWQRFALEAVYVTDSEQRFRCLRAALAAQQAYARTFALLRTLRHQQVGAVARAIPLDGTAGDTDRDSD